MNVFDKNDLDAAMKIRANRVDVEKCKKEQKKRSTMVATLKTSRLNSLFQIVILNLVLMEICQGSVLPRPNVRQRSTTQIADSDKNYTGERTIVIVTSSELPKQIPPPPTPTKPHQPTPKYDVTSPQKESFYKKSELQNKEPAYQYRLVP